MGTYEKPAAAAEEEAGCSRSGLHLGLYAMRPFAHSDTLKRGFQKVTH